VVKLIAHTPNGDFEFERKQANPLSRSGSEPHGRGVGGTSASAFPRFGGKLIWGVKKPGSILGENRYLLQADLGGSL